ncbi:hypothetical protein BBP40_011968 [Aspergillus hancockii]|nr:hypothetical protein BBP40_011968 [Aspergillus hancockii]
MNGPKNTQSQAPREVKIKWPKLDTTITVKLNDSNPSLTDLFGSALPYRSLQTHAVVAGDQLYHLVPLEQLIHLVIKYGTVTEHQAVATCGRVINEDLEKLRWVAEEIWRSQCETKQPIEVVLWDASKPEPDFKNLPVFKVQRTGVTNEVKSLVEEIYKELAATRPEFTLQHLIILYRDVIPPISEFVGHLGLEFLCDTYWKIDKLIKQNVEGNPNGGDAREDFLAMVSALAFYVNLLNAQNIHMFPWKHAAEYQIPAK